MKKLLMFLFIISVVFTSTEAFSYTIDDVIGDRIGEIGFELFGINAAKVGGNLVLDIFTNYPMAGITVGSWATFCADLALDFDRDGIFEHGVALTNHDNLTQGTLYNVSSWYESDHYAPPGGYVYNNGKIVTIADGTPVSNGTVTWDTVGNSPTYKISVPLAINDIFPPVVSNITPEGHGQIDVFFGNSTCANDFLGGTIPVAPEPISSALFLLGGGALAAIKFRKKK